MRHVARKRFGQHFLSDASVVDAIVDAIDPRPGQAVVEIGPGLGAMTLPLQVRCPELTVIELDRDLAARLRRIDSPLSAILCAPCTTRSRIASASVGSPSQACQAAGGNWLVMMVARVPTRSSSNSSRSARSCGTMGVSAKSSSTSTSAQAPTAIWARAWAMALARL